MPFLPPNQQRQSTEGITRTVNPKTHTYSDWTVTLLCSLGLKKMFFGSQLLALFNLAAPACLACYNVVSFRVLSEAMFSLSIGCQHDTARICC